MSMTTASLKFLTIQGCHTIHLKGSLGWYKFVLEGSGTITCLQGIVIKECFLGKKRNSNSSGSM